MTDTAPVRVAGIFSIASGLVHGVAVGLHTDHTAAARTFAVLAVVQVAAGLASMFVEDGRLRGVVAVVNVVSVIGWVVAKTSGIGFIDGLGESEAVQATDLLCAILAALAILFAVAPGMSTKLSLERLSATALAVILAVPAMVTASSHDHGTSTTDWPRPYFPGIGIDIEGVDAAHKLTIMSAIAFGVPVQFDKAHVEGISSLQAADIKYAEQLGYRIKLLGITKRTALGVELRVHPTLVPMQRLLASVEGAMNAVLVKGDAVGVTLYYGKGAGAEPTASAVVADLVDVTRMHTADPENRVPHLAFQAEHMADLPWLSIDDTVTSYYFRMRVADRPGVLADIARILADHRISIDALFQREPGEGESQTDIIMLTHDAVERDVNRAIAAIEALPTVLAKVIRIRQEELV